MTQLESILFFALLCVSALMSASEVALFSLSRFQLRALKERFRPAHKRIKRLIGDPGGLLVTILVGNELVNIGISAMVATAVARADWVERLRLALLPEAPDWAFQMLIGTLIAAPILLILCEITPKVIAARANQMVAPLVSGPMSAFYGFLRPVRYVLTRILQLVARLGRKGGARSHPDKDHVLREEEFLFMLEEGHKEGAIHESEMELIRNVFELDDTTAREVMTPLGLVFTLPASAPVSAGLAALKSEKYARIPLIGASPRQVVGVLYAKDLLRAKLDPSRAALPLGDLMRKPFLVPPTLRLNGLFRKFKQSQTHIAVVQGDSGEALGIVTMADVLDALFDSLLPDDERPKARPGAPG